MTVVSILSVYNPSSHARRWSTRRAYRAHCGYLATGGHITAADGCILHQPKSVFATLRRTQVGVEPLEPLQQSFAVVKPIHTDHHEAVFGHGKDFGRAVKLGQLWIAT